MAISTVKLVKAGVTALALTIGLVAGARAQITPGTQCFDEARRMWNTLDPNLDPQVKVIAFTKFMTMIGCLSPGAAQAIQPPPVPAPPPITFCDPTRRGGFMCY